MGKRIYDHEGTCEGCGAVTTVKTISMGTINNDEGNDVSVEIELCRKCGVEPFRCGKCNRFAKYNPDHMYEVPYSGSEYEPPDWVPVCDRCWSQLTEQKGR